MKELTAGERFQLHMECEEAAETMNEHIDSMVAEHGPGVLADFTLAKVMTQVLAEETTLAEREWLALHKASDIVKIHMEMMNEIRDRVEGDDLWAPLFIVDAMDRATQKIVDMLERK